MTVVQRRVALLGEDGRFNDSMTPQQVLDATEHCDEIAVTIDAHLAAMLAKSANLSDVPSPAAARVNLGVADAVHGHAIADVTGLTSALSAKADLVGGVVPTSQIPMRALVTAVPVANQAAMLALTASQVQPGDIAIRADGAGTWMLIDANPAVLGSWVLLVAPTDQVTSVNGQAGTVVLSAADVGAATPAQVTAACNAVQILAAGYATQAAGSASSAATSEANAAGSATSAHADRLLVAQDKTDTHADKLSADADAATATTQAGIATTQATNAATSATSAATSASNAAATLAGAVSKTTVDAKGDLLVGAANDSLSRLAVGADGAILVANSNAATGLAYQSPIPVLVNGVTNGGFTDATGWAGSANAAFAVASGVGSITPTAAGEYVGQSVTLTAGRRYYIAATVTVATTGTTAVTFGLASGAGSALATAAVTSAQTLTSVQVATATGAAALRITDGRTAGWTKVRIDNVLCIDLTAAFGAGFEPTLAEMDAIMATWGGWFAKEDPKLLPTYGWRKLTQGAGNLVTDGDFIAGTGWSGISGAIAASGDEMSHTGTNAASGTSIISRAAGAIAFVPGHHYYSRFEYYLSHAASSVYVENVGSGLGHYNSTPTVGAWTTTSVVDTIVTGSGISNQTTWIAAFNDSTNLDKVFKLRRPLILDLTAIFGAGGEPTQIEADYLLSRYPNSWFNGIVNDMLRYYDPLNRVGRGSPYNVITPRTKGETWTDLGQTCGARRWVATGTTTTSWVCTDGDTGVRALTLNSGYTGTLEVSRIGARVTLRLASISSGSTSATSHALITLPTGCRPTKDYYTGSLEAASRIKITTAGVVSIELATAAVLTSITQTVDLASRDTWFTTLPGTAS